MQVTDAMKQDLTDKVATALQISNPDLVSVTSITDARRRLLSVNVGVQALASDRCNIKQQFCPFVALPSLSSPFIAGQNGLK